MRSIKNRKLFAGHIARVVIQAALVLTAAAIMGCKTSPYPPAPQNAAKRESDLEFTDPRLCDRGSPEPFGPPKLLSK